MVFFINGIFYKWYFLYNNLSNSDFNNHFLNKNTKE